MLPREGSVPVLSTVGTWCGTAVPMVSPEREQTTPSAPRPTQTRQGRPWDKGNGRFHSGCSRLQAVDDTACSLTTGAEDNGAAAGALPLRAAQLADQALSATDSGKTHDHESVSIVQTLTAIRQVRPAHNGCEGCLRLGTSWVT